MEMTFLQRRQLLLLLAVATTCHAYFKTPNDACFCQLSGKIDECTCNIDTVDHFNNIKIYPRLQSLLLKDYFRFFKVNLKSQCPFWVDDSKCAMKFCHVQPCPDEDVPKGIKGATKRSNQRSEEECRRPSEGVGKSNPESYTKSDLEGYTKSNPEGCTKCKTPEDCSIRCPTLEGCEDRLDDLDYLNKTISPRTKEELELWKVHDDALDKFCVVNDNDDDNAEYVDLLLNPERYTGYKGESARRIWNSIYLENCFRPKTTFNLYIQTSKLNSMCLEERAYYRTISGLHTSINIHLCANYLLSNGPTLANPKGEWGPNLEEFRKRFSPETTNGEGPHWLRNLYFIYLLEMRAIAKVAPYLEREEFYTGDDSEDWDTRMAVRDLLGVVRQFPHHFDETTMFTGNDQAARLKYEFKEHFRNVTRIMDCVGCDKCKLWGKLQTRGLGTALDILFSGKINGEKKFQLQRDEIVALLNAFGRLSTSIYKLDDFRQMMNN